MYPKCAKKPQDLRLPTKILVHSIEREFLDVDQFYPKTGNRLQNFLFTIFTVLQSIMSILVQIILGYACADV